MKFLKDKTLDAVLNLSPQFTLFTNKGNYILDLL